MKRQLFIYLALLGLASPAAKAQYVPCFADGEDGPAIVHFGPPNDDPSNPTQIAASPGPGNSPNITITIFGGGSLFPTDFLAGDDASAFLEKHCQGLLNVYGHPPTNSLPWLPMNSIARARSATRSSTAPGHRTAAGSPRSFVFGQNSQTIASGDFTGAGSMDSAITNGAALTVTLYDSNDAVISSTNYNLPSTSTSGIVAGDFDGDGKLDLAVELDPFNNNGTTGSIGILLGNGDGTFAPAVSYPVSILASSLATASLHGNGKLDLITSGTGTANGTGGAYLAVLPGKGDGTFGTPTYSAIPPSISYSALIATDLTGDGKVDVAMAVGGEVVVYPGNGDGTFQPPKTSNVGSSSSSLAYADVNEDGVLDLAIADYANGAIYVVFGNGDGTFGAPQTYIAPANIGSVSLVPIADGTAMIFPDQLDGAMVFAFAGAAGQFYLPQPQVYGTLAQSQLPDIAAAELNGDQVSDLALTGSTGITVELNNGDGTFAPPAVYPTGSTPYSVAIADLNHDGKPDIVATTQSGASILMNSGAGLFQAGTPVPTGASGAFVIDDFNGDGKPDLAIMSSPASGNNTVSVVLGNGDGTFGPPLTFTLPAAPQNAPIASGDFTGHGKTDLIVGYQASDNFGINATLALYPGKGDGTFGTPSTLPVEGLTFAAGDLNGDKKLDLAIYQLSLTGNNQVVILLGNGDGTFQPPIDIPVYNASSILITDVNGDGKPDLVLGDCCGTFSEASFLLGKGDGNFGSQNYFPSGPNPNIVAAGNFASPTQPGLAIAGYHQLFGDLGAYSSPEFTVLQLGFPPSATVSACDIVSIGATSVADAQGIVNEALGASTALDDLNDDGWVNVVDVQIVINSVMGLGCAAS